MADLDVRLQVRIERNVSFPDGSVRHYADMVTVPVEDFLTANQARNLVTAARTAIVSVATARIQAWRRSIIDAPTVPPQTPEERWAYLDDQALAEIKAIAEAKGI